MAELNYRFRKFTDNTVLMVDIELTLEYKIRQWIAIRLIILASWILGCDIKINHG